MMTKMINCDEYVCLFTSLMHNMIACMLSTIFFFLVMLLNVQCVSVCVCVYFVFFIFMYIFHCMLFFMFN